MKRKMSIDELIDCKYDHFAQKEAFLMFIQDECELRGIRAENTIEYIARAKKKFEHQEAWEALIKEKDASEELNADATLEQFIGNITRVQVCFENAEGAKFYYKLLNEGLDILVKHGFDNYVGACIPATLGYEFLVYIPAKIVPDEFIRKYVEQHTF